jgi:hypothetical protein
MTRSRDLLAAHVDALFTQNTAGRLLAVNERGGGAAPRFFLGRTMNGWRSWFRHDEPDEIVRVLTAACDATEAIMETEAPADSFVALFAQILERHAPVRALARSRVPLSSRPARKNGGQRAGHG